VEKFLSCNVKESFKNLLIYCESSGTSLDSDVISYK